MFEALLRMGNDYVAQPIIDAVTHPADTLSAAGRIGYNYVVKPLVDIVTDPKNAVSNLVNKTKFVDKFFKGAEVGLEAGLQIAIASHASDKTIGAMNNSFNAVKGIRSGVGLLNSLNGAIPIAYSAGVVACRLAWSFFSDDSKEPVDLLATRPSDSEKELNNVESITINEGKPILRPTVTYTLRTKKHNEHAVGPIEKGLALIHHICLFGSAATYAANFLIVRPPSTLEKMSGQSFGEGVKKLSATSQHVWTANHACAVGQGVSGLFLEGFQLRRALNESERSICTNGINPYDLDQVIKDYKQKSMGHWLTLGEKLPELGIDVLKYAQFGHPGIRIGLAAVSVGFGLVKVCRDAAQAV